MKHASRLFAVLVIVSSGLAGCSGSTPPSSSSSAPAPAASAGNSADKEWAMPNKNYSANRYSELAQITVENVKTLKPAWTFSTGVLRGHEGEPIVVGDTMY